MNTCIENYEVTVGPGPLGISLCILRNGSGAFVESFYQSQDPMTEIMSVVALGDRIMRIGELDTSNANLDAILFALSNEPRPMVVLFCRYLQHDLVPFQLFDHRWNCWIEKFLNEEKPETVSYPIDDLTNVIHNYKIATMVIDYLAAGVSRDGENIQSIALECIMFCIRQFESDDVPEQLRDSINQLISLQGRGDDELLNALCAANSFLFGTLQRCVLEPFQHSTFAPRAVAWLSESPPFYRATLSEVLSDRIVGICYFLFLCQLRRQRSMHVYIKNRRGQASALCSPRTPKADARRQAVAVEAVRDGLLLAFYASSTYEALLGELAASNCARPSPAHATSSPWSAGSLQRIIRSVTPPAGISLHRGATLKSTARSVWPSFVTIDFDSVEAPAGEQPSLRVLRALHRSSAAATDSLLALNPASLLSHIVPTLMDARVQSGAKLISSRVAPKLGPTLYCAALVSYEHLPVSHDLGTSPDFSPAASTVESMTPPVEAVTPSTESPTGKEKTDRVPSLPSSWMGSVLSRAFDTTQYSARNPAHSSVSDYESLPLSRFSLLGLPSALPLSPFLRAVGIRPAAAPGTLAAADERDAAASSSPFAGPAWAVHSPLAPRLRQQQLPGWEGPTGKHSIRLSGVVVVTEVPCVVALRESLTEINVQRSRSAWWESDGCGNKLLRALERCQHPDSAKDTASDFSAQALFEVLGPSALAAVFVAFLVECRVVVIVDDSQSAALLLGEWLRQAVHPLQWCHVYSPVAPAGLAVDLLQCPAPYFLGIQRAALRGSPQPPPSDALVVDLDSGLLQVPPSLEAVLGAAKALAANLSAILRPAFHAIDSPAAGASAHAGGTALLGLNTGVAACRAFVHQLLQPLERCTLVLDEQEDLLVALDEERFLRKTLRWLAPSASDKKYVSAAEGLAKLFLRTQCCSEHALAIFKR